MSSNSVCNHTRDIQIGLPLRGRPILFITRMITDRIGLHSVLLPLLITHHRSELDIDGSRKKKNFFRLALRARHDTASRAILSYESIDHEGPSL